MIYFLTGCLLWMLAFLIKYLPEQVVVLLWGKRYRAILAGNGSVSTASKEMKITGSVLILKNLLDYLIWIF